MKKLLLLCLLAAYPASATTYFIAAAGSDANTSTQAQSKTTPWAHAPGMAAATGAAAAYTPIAGDQFVFKGNDTWIIAGQWNFPSSGSSGNSIGVLETDVTWFTGGSWGRPVFDGAGSFPGGTAGGTFLELGSHSFLDIGAGEFKGLNWSVSLCSNEDMYIDGGGVGTNVTIHDAYFHGWSHSAGVGECNDANAIYAAGTVSETNVIIHNVIDGTDTAQDSFGGINGGRFGDIRENVFIWLDNGLNGGYRLVHDNLFINVGFGCYSGCVSHNNVAESNLDQTGGFLFYNNVMIHIAPGAAGGVPVMIVPKAGDTSYAFNNVSADAGNYGGSTLWCGEFSAAGNSGGTCTFFNNTMEGGNDSNATKEPFRIGAGLLGTVPAAINEFNNHTITTAAQNFVSGECASCPITLTPNPNLIQSKATANGQGYTAVQTFAFSPTSAGNATVGAGVNKNALCATIASNNAAAGAACLKDTTYGVVYNATTHTVTGLARTAIVRPPSAAWDAGAYQFSSGLPAPSPALFTAVPLPATGPVPTISSLVPTQSYVTAKGCSQDGLTWNANCPVRVLCGGCSATTTATFDGKPVTATFKTGELDINIPLTLLPIPLVATQHLFALSNPANAPPVIQ